MEFYARSQQNNKSKCWQKNCSKMFETNKKEKKMKDKETKDNLIALRLNDEQTLAVKQWAKQHKSSVSEVIRCAIEMMTGAKR